MEWGALWVKEWRSSVTHVIVDRDLCFNDVLKFLKLPSLPVRNSSIGSHCLRAKLIIAAGYRRR